MYNRSVFLVPMLVVMAACGSVTTGATGGTGGASAANGAANGNAAATGSSAAGSLSSGSGNTMGEAFTVTFDPFTVAPGAENTQCIVKRIGNKTAIHVGTMHNVLSTASHHMIVYKTIDTVEQPKPFACKPFTDLLNPAKGSPVMITQKHDDTLDLPKGVAFPFTGDQMVRLEMHYLNPSPAPVQASATATFIVMPEADVKSEADFLFVGNPDINVPAHGTQTLGPSYLPLPKEVGDANFFGVTGHTHHFGTKVWAAIAPAKDGPDTPIYDVPGWTWSEPATVYHDPPFQVPAGGGFHFTCEWNNTSNAPVKFGESATAEMCFFWAYYYPSKGAFVCVHTDQVPGGYDLCCPGNALCSKLFP